MLLLNGVPQFHAICPIDQNHLYMNFLYQILCNPSQVNAVCKF